VSLGSAASIFIFRLGWGAMVANLEFMRISAQASDNGGLVPPTAKHARRKLRIIPLIAATYFMVSGGPYGIEDILGGAGFAKAILILVLLPFLWSLPTTLMIGELASSIPAEGGFYVWVRRALGPFWGYQEGWLSLAASVFDMAIYPTIFVDYLSRFNPDLTAGSRGYLWSLLVVVVCCVWNLRGAPAVGEGTVGLFVLLLAPFAVFVVLGFWHGFTAHPAIQWHQASTEASISTAILVAMWNYMGWDNASTVAQEVDNPQRNYPLAMVSAAMLVAVTYILPLAAVALMGIAVTNFTTGSWTDAARMIGGPVLATAVVAGGAINGFGMFNVLMMSYTRLPVAMAEDRMLPRFVTRRNSRGVPYVSVVLCAIAWALALNLKFERLISIDLSLYGVSLILEFVALVVLRMREPNLERPFKAGNFAVACALGLGPTALIIYALYASRDERLGGYPALAFTGAVALIGPIFYWITTWTQNRRKLAPTAAD
jgi:amino acid transporter